MSGASAGALAAVSFLADLPLGRSAIYNYTLSSSSSSSSSLYTNELLLKPMIESFQQLCSGEMTSNILRVATEARALTLGPFSPSFKVPTILVFSMLHHYHWRWTRLWRRALTNFFQTTCTQSWMGSYMCPWPRSTMGRTCSSTSSAASRRLSRCPFSISWSNYSVVVPPKCEMLFRLFLLLASSQCSLGGFHRGTGEPES